METAEEIFNRLAESLPGGKKSKMFGAPCIKAENGKAACMYYKGEMVFKLKGDEQNEALALDGAHMFNPMNDRPMNGWVQVPYSYADRWDEMARQSLEFVKTLR